MKYIRYSVAALVLLLSIGFTAYGEEPKPDVKSSMTPSAEAVKDVKSSAMSTAEVAQFEHTMGKEKRVVATMDADGVQRVEVIGGDYYFDPNYIVVKVNQPVEMTVKKAPGIIPHNMIVKAPEAGINFKADLDAKKPETIQFTPKKVGKYPVICDKKFLFFKSHKDRGMEGVIEVVE